MVNKKLAVVGTIMVGLIGALLSSIFSPVFSPLSEYIKDQISNPPDTRIVSAMTFDNNNKNVSKPVKESATIASSAITFNFTSDKPNLFPTRSLSNFECSFDGAPFEECMPPKPYGNLQTEVGHIFQVRAKGILGNTDKTPARFYFTTITSASVQGVARRNNTAEDLSNITLDSTSSPENTTADVKGRFQFEGVGQGNHTIDIYSNKDHKPYREYFFVPAGQQSPVDLKDLDIFNLSPVTRPTSNSKIHPSANREFKPSITTKSQNYSISLAQESKPTQQDQNILFTKISLNAPDDVLSKIENVTYYLHPTFKPSVITTYTRENKFSISFTNWGIFDLRAKVYFKDGTITDLELPVYKWTKS